MMLFLLIILICVAFIGLYKYRKYVNEYWIKRRVPFKSTFPIFGNMFGFLFQTKSLVDIIKDIYFDNPKARFIGFFNFVSPTVMIRDPEIIQLVTVKDFDHFINRSEIQTNSLDIMFGKGLPGLRDQKWKDMRATLSPAFTGSKMRAMFTLIDECSIEMTNYLEKTLTKVNANQIVDIKDILTKYTTNAIASVAFGLHCDSLKDPNNEFNLMGIKATKSSLAIKLKFFGFVVFPKLMQKFDIRFIDKDVSSYFSKIILGTMKEREKTEIIRPDLIQLLMELKKSGFIQESDQEKIEDAGFATARESNIGKRKFQNLSLDDDDLIAQALVFFIAGFEGTASSMTFIFYELALNPDVQEKLQEEVDDVLKKNNNKMTYESLQSMKYLDMVVSESLRKWMPALTVERICNKAYKLPSPYDDDSNNTIELEIGSEITIPIVGLHYDPQYYPDPERFDPERFNDENKRNIKPYTYLPFGIGPRNCIGSRLALMEMKAAAVHLVSKLKFVVCEKTEIPIKVDRVGFAVTAKNIMWLKVEPRNKLK